MNGLKMLGWVGVSLMSLCLSAGCSSDAATEGATAGTPEARDGLHDLANLLKTVDAEGGRLPRTATDFAQYDIAYPAAGALIQNGTIVYFPGASFDESDSEPEIVAMQADADTTGGWVLLSNGEVKDLTSAEVKALPQAGSAS